MISRALLSIFAFAICLPFNHLSFAQTGAGSDDTVRVTVSLNGDGSRTVFQFDNAKHEAIATTTEPDGKPRGKTVYQIDAAGRFASGVSSSADGKFLFKALYKYDSSGRPEQETHLAQDDSVIRKIVYKYASDGKQTGFSVFDGKGKLISGSTSATPSPKPRIPRGR